MNITRQEIYLAALLHDIGKFYQRADEHNTLSSRILSDDIKRLESVLCPNFKGVTTHKHVLWTAQFFKDFESHIKKLIQGRSSISYDKLMRLAAAHHYPDGDNIYERIIQKADHYSSGADRSVLDEAWKDTEEEIDKEWDKFRRIKMRSIFEGISLDSKPGNVWKAQYSGKLPLKKMDLSGSFFPKQTDIDLPDYEKLWYEFTSEIKFIQTNSYRTFAETLLYLLEKYASRIPSSTQHLPDVSLFDHAKTTAAFAVCLHDYIHDNGLTNLPGNDLNPFALIGGNLSGIQKFIYNIIPRGAAKNLKGRSFYLQLLIDNIVKTLIDDINLFDANIIYSSGGSFYVLAPNVKSLKNKLTDFENKITDKLFGFHKTDLYLCIDYEEFGEREIFTKVDENLELKNVRTISDTWSSLFEKISAKKNKRFQNKLCKDFNLFFTPSEEGGVSLKDAITGEEISTDAIDLDGRPVSKYTFSQISLGQKLRSVDYWVMSNQPITYFKDKYFNPIDINTYNYFVTTEEINSKSDQLKASADKVRALSINSLNFLETPQKGIDNIYGFTFYGGNDYPVSSWYDMPKTFEEICGVEFTDEKREKRKSSPGLVRLGILRMDVDNLGAIFKRGFSLDKRSFSRYSVLSRSLDYFFKGFINLIWSESDKEDREKKGYCDKTQIIYSGGDDLFIIGKWDILIEMAGEINKKFREWTCFNPEITLSGGISIVYPKFPLLKAAQMSEAEERNAKDHSYGSINKNSFSVFGYAFDWDHELNYIVELKEEIKRLFDLGLPKTFAGDIYNLMSKANFKLDNQEMKYNISDYSVVWLTAYAFKRASQRVKGQEVKDFFSKWINLIFTGRIESIPKTRYHAMQFLAIASRWASFERR